MQLLYDLFIRQIYVDSCQEDLCICKESFLADSQISSTHESWKFNESIASGIARPNALCTDHM